MLFGTFEVSLMVFKGFSKGFDITVAGERDCVRFHRSLKFFVELVISANDWLGNFQKFLKIRSHFD